MTLSEWTTAMTDAFRDAGFQVSEYQGFPLVKRPQIFEDTVRLLKFYPDLGSQYPTPEKRIYAEGMLLVPAGLPRK